MVLVWRYLYSWSSSQVENLSCTERVNSSVNGRSRLTACLDRSSWFLAYWTACRDHQLHAYLRLYREASGACRKKKVDDWSYSTLGQVVSEEGQYGYQSAKYTLERKYMGKTW
mmetsp:Transcript_100080/g.282487  ORF Transcript_100080/g.282487 Transcript_100080/m.282487 type:complete len:113 (+) Transcript_100080:407-745(+)